MSALPAVAPDPAVVARNAFASGLAVAPGLPSYDAALAFADAVLDVLPAAVLEIRLAASSPVFPMSARVFEVWVRAF